VNNVDFLWLNIGGAEGRVLQSIPHLIKTVQVIFIETYFQEFRQEIRLYKDVQQYLTQQGFEEIQHWKIQNFQGYALFARRKNK